MAKVLIAALTLFAAGARAQCTDPAPANACAPGGGSKVHECAMEWLFAPMPKRLSGGVAVPDALHGINRSRIICYEGDPRCDFDGADNASCTFHTKMCINNHDPRFDKCVASEVASFQVIQPNPSALKTAADGQNLAALEGGASTSFGVPIVRGNALFLAGSPNATANLCSDDVDLVIPMIVDPNSNKPKRTAKRIRVRGTNNAGVKHSETLQLDCRASTCGDGKIQTDHETCDDHNRLNGDGCDQACQIETGPTNTVGPSNTPTVTPTVTPTSPPAPRAFRVTSAAVMDPHVFVDPFHSGTGCSDITDPGPGLATLVNVNGTLLATELNTCTDDPNEPGPACHYSLSIVVIFDPLAQGAGDGGAVQVGVADDCVDADGNTSTTSDVSCTLTAAELKSTTYTSLASGTCLSTFAGTTGPHNGGILNSVDKPDNYTPAANVPTGPCAQTANLENLSFTFGDAAPITLDLEDVQLAARYVGNPATGLVQGLLRGFVPETTADQVHITITSGISLDVTLSEVLPGGADKCFGGANDGLPCTNPLDNGVQCPDGTCRISCAPGNGVTNQDDRDYNPAGDSGGSRGWWFYLNLASNQSVAYQLQ